MKHKTCHDCQYHYGGLRVQVLVDEEWVDNFVILDGVCNHPDYGPQHQRVMVQVNGHVNFRMLDGDLANFCDGYASKMALRED